jgi:hypothetical protein
MGEWMCRSTLFSTSALVGGEWSASRPGERASGTHWVGGWVDPRAGLDDVEKRKFLTLPGLELRPLGHAACSQSLYRLYYPGSTLSLCSSLNVRDQVLHPYRTTGKITVSYIVIFMLLDSRRDDKRFCTKWWPALPEFNLLLISSWIRFWFVILVPKYLNCAMWLIFNEIQTNATPLSIFARFYVRNSNEWTSKSMKYVIRKLRNPNGVGL